jgi:hypothetical protein
MPLKLLDHSNEGGSSESSGKTDEAGRTPENMFKNVDRVM